MTQRMFLAVIPPDVAIEDLDGFLAPRRAHDTLGRAHAPLRWTRPESWHLTLAFLPAVADRDLDVLEETVAGAVSRRTALTATIAGGGAFPDAAAARVLWAGFGVDDIAATELDRLARGVRTAATRAGLETPREPFRPHVTVARAPRPVDATRWLRVLDTYAGPAFAIEEITLLASVPRSGGRGRRHERVADFRLG